MDETTVRRRLPRAGVDAIDDPATALATIAMVMRRPLRPETIVVLLDDARRGLGIVVVSGTVCRDAVIEVVECVTQGVGCEQLGAIIVGSVRPPAPVVPDAPDAPTGGDVDRWLEMSEISSIAGVELLEWFVIGRAVSCPRDDLAEPPRW